MANLFRPGGAPAWLELFKLSIERALARVERMPTYTVATAPSASEHVREWIFVSDEAGGATPAFSDGTDWRRTSDRAVIS